MCNTPSYSDIQIVVRGIFRVVRYVYLFLVDMYGSMRQGEVGNEMDFKTPNEEFRFVLIGKTGNGKSSTGNSLLGFSLEDENCFKTTFGASLTTMKCQMKTRQVLGKQLLLVDTPGVLNTTLTEKATRKEIEQKVIGMTAPGPHAFLLILRCDVRYTQEDEKVVSEIKQIFGKDVMKYMVVIFTRLDELEKNHLSEEEMIKSSSQQLQALLRQCNNRWLCINNFDTRDRLREKLAYLIDIVSRMRSDMKFQYFCNRRLKKFESWLRMKMKQKKDHSFQGPGNVDRAEEFMAMRISYREDVERENPNVLEVLSAITESSPCSCCNIL